MNQRNTTWEKVADWYDKTVNDSDSYQNQVVLPNVLRIIDAKPRQIIVDIACGQGLLVHAIAKTGARVYGADGAKTLIAFAKKHAAQNESFDVAPAHALPYPDVSADTASMILAAQNIENLAAAFREAGRIVKRGGKFVVALNHPAFRNPKETSWGFDEEKKIQYRRVDEYLSESRVEIDMNPGETREHKKETTFSFHRPMQVYAKTLANAGFAIVRIEEWTSHRRSEPGPRQKAEDKARQEIPLFMCLECVKL